MNDVQVRRDRLSCESHSNLTLFFGLQTLQVDGYISQTFRSREAEQYFLNLIKSDTVPPHVTFSYAEREGSFFFVHSGPPHIPFSSLQDFWLLDRSIVDRGTVVPQKMWTPHSVLDRRQHVQRAHLQMPIFFEGENGRLGISLAESTHSRRLSLRDPNHPTPLGQKSSTYIRIAVSMVMVGVCSCAKFIHGEY